MCDTAAVGAAYFQASGDQALTYQVRAVSGDMPSTPGVAAIAAHGLPADVPLMRALEPTSQAMFFGDCHTASETEGFIDLGVASLAAAPVRRADGKLMGAFLMHTFNQHTWNDSEAALSSPGSGEASPGALSSPRGSAGCSSIGQNGFAWASLASMPQNSYFFPLPLV